MAAGQVYDHGHGGAGRLPLGSALGFESRPDALAHVQTTQEKGDGPSGIRKLLAAVGIRGAGIERPESEPTIAHDGSDDVSAAMSNEIQQPPEADAYVQPAGLEVPSDSQVSPPNTDKVQ